MRQQNDSICSYCEGSGNCMCLCGHTHDCPECDGTGQSLSETFPAKLYLFNSAGKYNSHNVLTLKNPDELAASMPLIKAHIQDGKEVRITDPMDYCLFHAKDKKIIFPS